MIKVLHFVVQFVSCPRHNKVARSFLSGPGFSLSSKFKFNGRSMERASI